MVYNLITCRHSERKYKEDRISDEMLSKIIDAGLASPSGQNSQPWHFTVLQNKEMQKELLETCKNRFLNSDVEWRKTWAKSPNFNPFYSPDVIIIISNKNTVRYSNEDCCFAIQNMTIMAESLGLSSCIIRDVVWAIDKTNQEKYGIPSEYDCFMCLSVGYAANKNNTKKSFDYSKVNYIK